MDNKTVIVSDNVLLLVEARDFMDNTHGYDQPLFYKIEATLDGIKEGKTYASSFYDDIFQYFLNYCENTHSEDSAIYNKIYG